MHEDLLVGCASSAILKGSARDGGPKDGGTLRYTWYHLKDAGLGGNHDREEVPAEPAKSNDESVLVAVEPSHHWRKVALL